MSESIEQLNSDESTDTAQNKIVQDILAQEQQKHNTEKTQNEYYSDFKKAVKNYSKNEIIRLLFNSMMEATMYRKGYEHYNDLAKLAMEQDKSTVKEDKNE